MSGTHLAPHLLTGLGGGQGVELGHRGHRHGGHVGHGEGVQLRVGGGRGGAQHRVDGVRVHHESVHLARQGRHLRLLEEGGEQTGVGQADGAATLSLLAG